MPDRPTAGQLEDRALPLEVDGRRIRGVIPYGVESRDMGGWREVIDRGALDAANLDELVAVVEHRGLPIGRHPRTLEIEDRDDGLHWSVEPPRSRQDVVEAVERGDLRSGSWRMAVGRDRWVGDVRHIEAISELRHVSLTSVPAYPSAAVELRSAPEEDAVPTETPTPTPAPPEPAPQPPPPPEAATAPAEDRSAPSLPGLSVEDARAPSGRARGLTDRFRAEGWPQETATLPFEQALFEDRALTVSVVDRIQAAERVQGVALGADNRWGWTQFPRAGVDAGVTAVEVIRQASRSLAAPGSVIRVIDATSPKPETDSAVEIVATALKQVASVSTGIPNVYLESPAVNAIVEGDLRLSVNAGLDSLVLTALAGAGFEAPGGNVLDAIRKAITTIEAAGYAPDLVILDPASAESLDLMKATATAGESVYVFSPGVGAPRSIWTLRAVVAKDAPAPVVVDSSAVGRLYLSPVSLARFEENAGSTNTSTVRLETHALFGVERIDAAVRVASS